jgi:hypothetical protein
MIFPQNFNGKNLKSAGQKNRPRDSRMSETQPCATEQKMVSRNIALTLGIICIILVAGLVGPLVYYALTHNHSDSEYAALQSQLNDLTDEINGGKQVVLVNETVNTGNNYTAWHFLANLTGSVAITVHPPHYTTYAQIIWNVPVLFSGDYQSTIQYVHNVSFNDLGGYETVSFPVVVLNYFYPYSNTGTDVEIIVGGINVTNAYSETVAITYYY